MDLEVDLPIPLPAHLVGAVVDATRRAGDIAARNYNEQDRWDSIAFGVLLYRLVWNHTRDALEAAGVMPWLDENSLRFQLGGYTCAIYSGGHHALWDIHRYYFDRTPKRSAASNPAQGRMFDLRQVNPRPVAEPEKLKVLHFVYCGNPHDGVAALYLGAPVHDEAQSRWGWVECLYRADHEHGAADEDVVELPAYTEQPEVELDVLLIREAGSADGETEAGA